MATVTRQTFIARWTSPEARPLFKGELIDSDGCCCAQGDVLRMCGTSDAELREMDQTKADREVAKVLGISVSHAVCLRRVNDQQNGCPQDVLDLEHGGIQKVLGKDANLVLALWHHIDAMTPEARSAAGSAAGIVARSAAGSAAWIVAWIVAWSAARGAAGSAAGNAAGNAAVECCGWSRLTSAPYFMPLLGITDPVAWVEAIDPSANREREAFIAGGVAAMAARGEG